MGDNPVTLTAFTDAAAVRNTAAFTVGGARHQVGPAPTPALLDLLAGIDVTGVVPGLCTPASAAQLIDALHQRGSGITTRLLARIGCEVIGALSGCPWWSACILATTLKENWWTLDAAVRLESGIDLLALPLPRTLATVYHLGVRGLGDGARQDVQAQIWERPVWADSFDNATAPTAATAPARKRRWTPQQQAASFAAFAAMGAAYNAAG